METQKEIIPIELDPIQGQIILFAKGHYEKHNATQLEGLRRIWAVRCGLMNEHTEDGQSDEYIADDLFRLIKKLMPEKADRMWEVIHRQLARPDYQYQDLNPIETMIMIYRSELFGMQVREKVEGKWHWLMTFPKTKKRAMNRILRGNGRYTDYQLIAK